MIHVYRTIILVITIILSTEVDEASAGSGRARPDGCVDVWGALGTCGPSQATCLHLTLCKPSATPAMPTSLCSPLCIKPDHLT